MSLKQLSKTRTFSGWLYKYSHNSDVCKSSMNFNIYLPDITKQNYKLPTLYFLSGLTCSEDNFAQKSTVAFQYCYQHQIALVLPDTSPRVDELKQHSDSWDFGTAASFYVNATQSPWNKYFNMYDYIVNELPNIINNEIPDIDNTRRSIFGHSMGGHGALMIFLRNAGLFKSVSAFAPITNPIECQWGKKAFTGYLGSDSKEYADGWAKYDSTMLVKVYNGPKADILIDQGKDDKFYIEKQLLPERFAESCSGNHQYVNLNLRLHDYYDHSYYFISTFIKDHIEHHAKYLNAKL